MDADLKCHSKDIRGLAVTYFFAGQESCFDTLQAHGHDQPPNGANR